MGLAIKDARLEGYAYGMASVRGTHMRDAHEMAAAYEVAA
jgi:hypothetical protein